MSKTQTSFQPASRPQTRSFTSRTAPRTCAAFSSVRPTRGQTAATGHATAPPARRLTSRLSGWATWTASRMSGRHERFEDFQREIVKRSLAELDAGRYCGYQIADSGRRSIR